MRAAEIPLQRPLPHANGSTALALQQSKLV